MSACDAAASREIADSGHTLARTSDVMADFIDDLQILLALVQNTLDIRKSLDVLCHTARNPVVLILEMEILA